MRVALLLLLAALQPVAAQRGDDPVGLGFAFAVGSDGRTVVTAVAPGGAAEAAGLQAGDLLIALHGEPLPLGDFALVFLAITEAREQPPPIPARIERDGAALTLGLGLAPYEVEGLLRAEAAFLCTSGDCWTGEGVWQHPDGTRYVGSFHNGERHGKGTYFWRDSGWSWRGIWRDARGPRGGYYAPDGTLHERGSFDANYRP